MTKVIAHRGSKGTHPENTLLAFQEAVAVGAEGIELDVHLTKDGQLAVIHDETLTRTTNGQGEVRDYTLEELQQFDAGSWFDPAFAQAKIPSFPEVLALLEGLSFRGLLNIEIKTDVHDYPGIEEQVVAAMAAQNWSFDYMYSSFNFQTLVKVQQLAPTIAKAYIMETEAAKIATGLTNVFIDSLHPKITWVMKQGEQIEQVGKNLRPWTVNQESQFDFCFRHQLAGFHTDFPEKALRYREAMKSEG